MQKYVYSVEGKDYGKLKDIVAADPFAKDSFVVAGYTLKESKPLGLKGGFYILFFKTADAELAQKLIARIKPLPTLKEMEGEEKQKVISQIESEEDSAASGFGSIFG